MEVSKGQIAEWWSGHPQDYSGWNAPPQLDDTAFTSYLERADDALRRDHFDLHDGQFFFGRLIPHAALHRKKVLEVGCGLGAASEAMARAGLQVVALDLSEFGVRAARWRMRANRLPGQVVLGDAEDLPFPANTFDFVWCWGAIHHSPNTARAVAQIYRVLAPGGSTCVMVYHRSSIYAYVNILLRRGVGKLQLITHSPDELLTRYSDGRESGGSPLAQYFSKCQVQDMFRAFSRVTISVHGYGSDLVKAFPPNWGIRRAVAALVPESAAQSLMSRFGHFLIIQATK